MASKTFGELCGVRICNINNNTEINTSYLCTPDQRKDYKVTYQGDPIFIIDYTLGIIKACIVKTIRRTGFGNLVIKCSEKGKNQHFIPIVEDFYASKNASFEGCITVEVNEKSSAYRNVATTLSEAIKLLNRYKNKGIFASLGKGDKIYDVNRHNNKITELTIEDIKKFGSVSFPTFEIFCNGKTVIQISKKFYDEKASLFNDGSFAFSLKGKWCGSYHFIFVSKKKAEAFLNERIKADKKKNVQKKNGTDTKLKDNKGNSLYIGDTVAYIDGTGSFLRISTAKIVNNSEKMVKIFDEEAKKSHIEYWERINKRRIEEGLEPFVLDYTDVGFKNVGTNKILKIKNYD